VIWYIARDTFQDRWFSVFYDDRYFWAAINRARRLRRYIREGILPPAEGRLNREIGYLCKGCPFWRACGANSPNPTPYLRNFTQT